VLEKEYGVLLRDLAKKADHEEIARSDHILQTLSQSV
jgi:hypothetical protein